MLHVRRLAALFPVLAALVAAAPAHATLTTVFPSATNVAFSDVAEGLAQAPDGKLYVGGNFYTTGRRIGHGTTFKIGGQGVALAFPNIDGPVEAVVADGSNGWFIGGRFNYVGGVARHNLVHVLANGTVATGFHPNPDGGVDALARSGTSLWVGGSYTHISGTAVKNLAAVSTADGHAVLTNAPADNEVLALALSGSTLYVGGYFGGIGSTGRNGAAAVDATTGALLAWDPQTDCCITNLAVQSGSVIMAGTFSAVHGTARSGLASVTTVSAALNGWNPAPASGTVYALLATPAGLYVGGGFNDIAGQTGIGRLVHFNLNGSIDTSWHPAPNGYVNTLALSGFSIMAGGRFNSIGQGTWQYRNSLAAIGPDGSVTSWSPSLAGYPVSAIATSDDGLHLFAGGVESGTAPVQTNPVVAIGTDGKLIGGVGKSSGEVQGLGIDGSKLIIGGNFTKVGSLLKDDLAAIDRSTGSVLAWHPVLDQYPYTVYVAGGRIFVAGRFTHVNGQPREHIAAFDATTLQLLPWHVNADNDVYTMREINGTLYLGGTFTHIDGVSHKYLAAVSATTGAPLSWDPHIDSYVESLATDGSRLYVGGQFSNVGAVTRQGFAAFDGTTRALSALRADTDDHVFAVSVHAGIVYLGGLFKHIDDISFGATPRTYLAALSVSTGHVLDWAPSIPSYSGSYPISAISVCGTRVTVVGGLDGIGGSGGEGIGMIHTPGATSAVCPLP